jgi:transposase
MSAASPPALSSPRCLKSATSTAERRAALIGVTSVNRGQMRGHRAIAGGRMSIRSVLTMATLSAVCQNPTFKTHDQQLIARGRPTKVATVA